MAPNNGKKTYSCLVCKANLKRTETCVQCQVCEEYTHPDCSNISKDLLKYLVDENNEGNSISWSCSHCTKVAKVLNNKVKVLSKEIQDIKKDVADVKKDYADLKKDVADVNKKSEENEKKCSENKTNMRKDIFAELRDREDKKCNIIVHGIDEAPETARTAQAKKDHDLKLVREVAASIDVDISDETSIKFIKRIGPKPTEVENEKCRPILLGLNCEELKKKIVKNRKKLHETYESVYIVPDMTKQQREEEDGLWEEANKRNNELDDETALNSHWKVIGSRGEKRLLLCKKIDPMNNTMRGRGRGRGSWRAGRGRFIPDRETSQSKKRVRTPETEKSKKKTRQSEVEEETGAEMTEEDRAEEEEEMSSQD
jgi:hypothetical protein